MVRDGAKQLVSFLKAIMTADAACSAEGTLCEPLNMLQSWCAKLIFEKPGALPFPAAIGAAQSASRRAMEPCEKPPDRQSKA